MDTIVPLKTPATAGAPASQEPLSAARQVLADALQHFSSQPSQPSQTPAWTTKELTSLQTEGDEELLIEGLLHVAGRLKNQNQPEASAFLLASLAESKIAAEPRKRAAAELAAMNGGGDFGQRAEFLISGFTKNATDARLIAPMLGATFLGQAAGSLALGRLLAPAARGSGSFLSSAWVARLGAGSIGFISEASAFTVIGRALSPHTPGPWSDDFARSAVTVGVLKFAGVTGRGLGQQAARTPLSAIPQISKVALPQATALGGLMVAHRLEENFGLRPHVEGQSLFFESLATLLTLNVGARLGHQALGRSFHEMQGELAFRSRQLSVMPRLPELFAVRQPALALAGAAPRPSSPGENGFGQMWMMANNMGAGGLGGGNGNGNGGGGKKGTGHFGSGQASSAMAKIRQGSGSLNSGQQRPQTLDPADLIEDTSIPPEYGSPTPSPSVETLDPYVGQVIDGRYRIDKVLGEGGMGIVYLGYQQALQKQIAMKVLKPGVNDSPEMVVRFLNEAQAASAIGNPHIIEVSDFGKLPDGSAYFVMEFLKGHMLLDHADQGVALPLAETIHIGRQLAEGLGAAHEVGIVHRDLKPENVFLITHGKQKNFVKILDFGIAKFKANEKPGHTRLTQEGQVFGTPDYISPEQAAGPDIDHRADIYSYGVMLYEMATGQLPFRGNAAELLTKHMFKKPPAPRAVVANPEQVPLGLEAIILKCMEKDPSLRYQSMEAIIADLDKLQSGLTPDAVADKARRGDELVIPDYFKNGAVPPRIPTPNDGSRTNETMFVRRGKPRWPIYAVGGLSVTAVGITAALIATLRSNGEDKKNSQQPPVTVPPPVPTLQVTPIEPDAGRGPEKISVVLSIEPADAKVFHEDKDLGKSPVLIQLEKGSKMELVVRREGYKIRDITIDGSQEKLSLKLEKDGKPSPNPSGNLRPKGSGTTPKVPKPKGSAEEIFKPWE